VNDASEEIAQTSHAPSAAERLITAVRRHPLTARVARRLCDRCELYPIAPAPLLRRESIIVGCSGGADSVALLLVLTGLARQRRLHWPEPIAVTIDHGFRPEAEAECAAVEALAEQLGIACERLRIRPGERPGNASANARTDRLGALLEVARRREALWIALGHHADDRLETLLLGVAAGRGLRGMAHPAWTRPADEGESIHIIRPLLDTPKRACTDLCAQLGLAVAQDPGNGDDRRARGYLRTSVLPALTARWPSLAINASHAIDEAALAVEFIERAARRLLRKAAIPLDSTDAKARSTSWWHRAPLSHADPILRRWALRSAVLRATHGESRQRVHRVPRALWERIALAVGDGRRSRRRFDLWGVGTMIVRATRVELRLLPGAARPPRPDWNCDVIDD
jgi:tRNA(Ile)-lysidine synthase